jgi:hypothetical protein
MANDHAMRDSFFRGQILCDSRYGSPNLRKSEIIGYDPAPSGSSEVNP